MRICGAVLLYVMCACAVATRPCSVSGCENGGTCIDFSRHSSKHPRAHCECVAGYTGEVCETRMTSCDQNPCRNGGSCFEADFHANKFTCSCSSKFTGEFCEVNRNLCDEPGHCSNGGTCVYVDGYTTCLCPFAFAGERCERKLDRCALSRACLHGGRCVDDLCVCLNGFSGERCERVVPLFDDYARLRCAEQPEFCAWRFADGVCDEECNDRNCFFDGFDCVANSSHLCRYREYCAVSYANGVCERECVGAECGGDGGDCDADGGFVREWPHRALAVLVHAPPALVLPKLRLLTATLAQTLHAQVRFAFDSSGYDRVHYWTLANGIGNRVPLNAHYEGSDTQLEEADGIMVYFNVDVSDCLPQSSSNISRLSAVPCFADVSGAAAYIVTQLDTKEGGEWRIAGLPVRQVYAEPKLVTPIFGFAFRIFIGLTVGLCCILLLFAIYGFHKIIKRQKGGPQTLSAPIWKVPRLSEPPVRLPSRRRVWSKGESSSGFGECESCLASSAPLSKHFRTGTQPRRPPLADPSALKVSAKELEKMITLELRSSPGSVGNAPASTSSQCTVLQDDLGTETSLLRAIRVRCRELVEFVLLQGADVNCADADGNTALHHAVAVNSAEILRVLLDTSHCNLRAVNVLGQTALTLAIRLPDVSDDCALLLIAFMNEQFWKGRNEENGSRLCLSSFSMHRANSEPITYLLLPSQKSGLKLSREMLTEDNDGTVIDYSGRSPLHYAALNNRCGLVSVLCACGVPLNRTDTEGDTAIHLAAREGHFHMVKFLLELGADKTIKNRLGCSAMDTASEKGWNAVAELLEFSAPVTPRFIKSATRSKK